MGTFEANHWRRYNVLRRLCGIGALVNGSVLALWSLSLVLRPHATISLNGEVTSSVWAKLGGLVASLVAVAIGLLIVRSRTYRPDLGDSHWFVDPQLSAGDSRSGRNWWTGDRKVNTARAAV
jgi:hypothetical protein